MVGHVGDGNFHVAIQYDPKDKDSYKIIREFSNKLIQKALDELCIYKKLKSLIVNFVLLYTKCKFQK